MPTQYLDFGTSVASVTVDDGMEFPDLPAGATVITEAEYTVAHDAIKAVVEAARVTVEAAELAEAKAAYAALRLLPGITDAVARRLSGFTGDTGGLLS